MSVVVHWSCMSTPVSSDRAMPAAAIADTAPATNPTVARPAATFARRRLRLGILGVGTSVVLSVVWLTALLTGIVSIDADFRLTPFPLSRAGDAALLVLAVFAAHALLLGMIEYVGGAVEVRERPATGQWLISWTRGVLVQGALLGAFAFAAALAASLVGGMGVLSVVCGGALTMLAVQGLIARSMAQMSALPANEEVGGRALANGIRDTSVRVIDVRDEAFVGGWIGLTTPQLWIPQRWTHAEHHDLLDIQLARRHAQFTSGARRRAIWRAVLWPAVGVALAALVLPWSFTHSAMWLALPAVSTLWTFVAVLVLPSFSRPAVYSADAAAAKRLGAARVVAAIRQLDVWQDDEPERSPGVEFIFHPVPSRNNRERALSRGTRATFGGGHQQTRLTLFASLAGFGLLGRVVHCNIGRPSLWAVYPGD